MGAKNSVSIRGNGSRKKSSLGTIAIVGAGRPEHSTLKYLIEKYGISTKGLELESILSKK